MKPARRLLAEGPDPLPVRTNKPGHFKCADCGKTLPLSELGQHPRGDACKRCSPKRYVETIWTNPLGPTEHR